tara:strand:+ start:2353 stop:2550 length:198 start_codon:yes stop_codon:yes gene_type:complete
MKVGDLVRVSNAGFSAIGFIKEPHPSRLEAYWVYYLNVYQGSNNIGNNNEGLWTKEYITAIKETT